MQRLKLYVLFALLLGLSISGMAQETTATLSGTITDQSKSPLASAVISVKYLPTGYEVHAQTNNRGLFVIPNLKPGGPYTVVISFVGYRSDTTDNVNLSLGNNPDLLIALAPASNELKEVVVGSARRNTTSGLTVAARQLNVLPTLGRSLSDFTRLTPQSNNNSFAGTNFRYNNITLDGAVNNDAIGFSNSFGGVSGGGQAGTSGAGSRTNPYSIDVIQEVQVQLSPYDVKLGNFTGGSVNAVTKSGANDFHGSIYGYGRNQALVGKSVDGLKTKIGSDFYDYQTGATISGPIVKNKLFFIANYEVTRRQEPTFYNAGDPGAAISLADAQNISNYLKTNFNYDPGTYGAYKVQTNSNKFFGRLDWNISSKSTLMVRGIVTHGWGNNLERTSTNFQFGNFDFTQHSKNVNIVGELKTKFSNNVNNQLILSHINVHDYRDFPGTVAPMIDINGGQIWAGTWREAAIFNMTQKTNEITDNLTWNKGVHKFTFGTHNEFYDVTYGFVNSWNGRWEYSSLTSFYGNQPSRIRSGYSFDPDKTGRNDLYNNPPGHFKINLLSAYVQDEIAISKKFKLSPGIRFDYSMTNEQPATDPAVDTTQNYVSNNPTYTHTPWNELNNKWLNDLTVSPRLGFSYDVKGNQSFVIRGGTGIFTGRMPFAWFGNAATLNGTTLGNIDYKPGGKVVPLAIDPTTLKDTVAKYGGPSASSTHEVDLIDNNFKLPTIWRSNIAADIRFGKGYKLTLDAMYTKTLYDVQFQQINIKDSAVYYSTGPTQSPIYVGGKVNSAFSNAYLLTNTKEGYRYNLTAQISKTTNNVRMGDHSLNFNWMVAYTYGVSKDISNGIRNSFSSNYEQNPAIIPNSPVLASSNFDLRHRIVGTTSLGFNWSESNVTTLTLFYAGQSGSPYTFIYSSSPNPFGNASSSNLVYIPKVGEQMNFADIKDATTGTVTYSAAQQQADFNSYVDGDKYLSARRGEYALRNGQRTPWNHEVDLKLMHEFKFKNKNTLQLSVDLFNVLNFINNDWGHISFVTNVNNYNVNLLKFANDANGKAPGAPSTGYTPTFNYVKPPSTGHYYTTDPINSRWQGQFGVKYIF